MSKGKLNRFLEYFDNTMRDRIIEFGKALSKIDTDIFIVMARKSASLICAMTEIGLVSLDGQIVSDRVLDMDLSWLQNKRITIVDDVIISGTTLYQVIKKLKSVNTASVNVAVIAINEDWFVPELLIDKNGKSALLPIHISLNNNECIQFCADVIAAMLSVPRPYDMDFPFFKNIVIKEDTFAHLIEGPSFDAFETTTEGQKEQHVFSYSFVPTQDTLAQYDRYLGVECSRFSLVKLRVFYKIDECGQLYSINVLPMVIVKHISITSVNEAFASILHCHENLKDWFITPESKLRLIQYLLSIELVKFWIDTMNIDSKNRFVSHMDFLTSNMLFPQGIVDAINTIDIRRISFNFAVVQNNLNSEYPSSTITDNDIFENQYIVSSVLTKPFQDLYYQKEIPARKLVKEHKKKVFHIAEYEEIINRLNRGVSIDNLENVLSCVTLFDVQKMVSVFIDRAIDIGIIVPIMGNKNGLLFRAYRHGEDVLFSKREESLCYIMLKSFYDEIKSKSAYIPKLWAEKLLVLFIRYGCEERFLTRFVSKSDAIRRLLNKKGTDEYILSVKYYLYGAVTMKNTNFSSIDAEKKVLLDAPFLGGSLHGN